MRYFSKTTKGFYPGNMEAKHLPSDVVSVDEDTYTALMQQQQTGLFIGADSGGNPIAVDGRADAAKAIYKELARRALEQTDMVALRCFKVGVAFPSTWATYVSALRAVVSNPSPDVTVPLPTQPPYPKNT